MINVIGLGYIGLPTALMMASHGVEVIGTDYNKDLVDTLNAGKTTFKEDGLDELFNDAVKAGIKFTTEYQKTDVYIVSVPTPYDKFSKKVDACYVVAAVKEVMKVDGVINLIEIRIYNEYNGRYSLTISSLPRYTEFNCNDGEEEKGNEDELNRFRIDIDALDGILYSDSESMYEIKYKDTDIRVRARER